MTGRPRGAAAACLLLLGLLTGCAGLFGPSIAAPTVGITGVDVSRPGLFSQELMLTLTFRNRMARDLQIEAVSFELAVNGDRLGSGLLLKPLTLPAEGAISVDVPVKVRTADLVDALVRLAQVPQMAYALDGRLTLGGDDAGRTLGFEDEGALSLPDSMPAGLAT